VPGYRLGPLQFATGMSGLNAWTYLYVCLAIMPVISFLSFSQPYVLTEIIGIPPDHRLSFDLNFYRRREITIQNVRRQNGCAQAAIDAIATGQVNVDPQVTHHFPLAETREAFELVADYRDGVIKACLRPADSGGG
jgi:threonine dehydrogenase-like Zn-dependent dehydrogenase